MNEKRYLKFFYPILENNEQLPVGLKFTQLYTSIQTKDDLDINTGKYNPEDLTLRKVCVEKYGIPQSMVYPQFNKPISKFIKIGNGFDNGN